MSKVTFAKISIILHVNNFIIYFFKCYYYGNTRGCAIAHIRLRGQLDCEVITIYQAGCKLAFRTYYFWLIFY